MKMIAAAVSLALTLAFPAYAQTYKDVNGTVVPGVTIVGGPYTLASNVNAAGTTTAVFVLKNPNYILDCEATAWNGASAQLQGLLSDGVTWSASGVAAITFNNTVNVNAGNEYVRIVVTGTPTGLTCGLR